MLYNRTKKINCFKTEVRAIIMSREERKNMIEFITKLRSLNQEQLIYMTDAEIEHIDNQTYYHYEEIAE